MKFFTPEWATGELTDEEFESTEDRYSDYLSDLNLPAKVLSLAKADLHDGLMERVHEAAGTLTVTLVCGDLQRGYFETTITYEDPLAWGANVTLPQFAAKGSDLEVIEHEVDRLDSGFVHRILFSSYEETEIAFSSASVSQRFRESRQLKSDTSPN